MILTIIGARPQFIKASVVSKALQQLSLPEKIIHTGQHYDQKMSTVFWEELNIPESFVNLNVGSGLQGYQTASIIQKLEEFILNMEKKPVCMLLYGDTNSTLGSSIVASKMDIPIVHIESGLRSFNRQMPEEINRIVTDHLSHVLFCSSATGVDQLSSEGITERVYLSGDVMYDAILQFSGIALKKIPLEKITGQTKNKFCLLTLHRPSNTDDLQRLKSIIDHMGALDTHILWPLHPRLNQKLDKTSIPENITITGPLSYLEMLVILNNCYKVFTDSGGLQKEAYWIRKPCITLRSETEWVETMHNNWNILCNTPGKLQEAFALYVDTATWKPLYGDGSASQKIAGVLRDSFF